MKTRLAIVALSVAIGSTIVAAPASKGDILATFGKETITVSELNQRIKSLPAEYQQALTKKDIKARLLDQMIEEKLLTTAAKKAGIDKTESYRNQVVSAEKNILLGSFIREKIQAGITVTDKEVSDYYTTNAAQFQEKEEREASHILVKTEAEAADILKALQGGADFSTLAKTKSIDPSASTNAGDLGWFSKGQMVPEFEKAVFELNKGQISAAIKTQFGYHIIKLNDMRTRPKVDFTPQLAAQIKSSLLAEKQRQAIEAYLEKLKKENPITKNLNKI